MKSKLARLYSYKHASTIIGIFALAATALVTGCSSDSDSGGGNGFKAPNINTTPVTLSSANSNIAAKTGLEGSSGSITSGSSNPFAIEISGPDSTISESRISFIKEKIVSAVGNAAPSIMNSSAPVGAVIDETILCDNNGGSMRFSGNSNGVNEIVKGDTFTISFNNCLDNFDGSISNGSMTVTFNSNSPINQIEFGNFDFLMTFDNLRISDTDGNNLVVMHGDMQLIFQTTGNDTTITMKGSSIYLLDAETDLLLTNYNINASSNSATRTEQVVATFTIASTELNGSITVASDITFANGSLQPTSGTMTATGANAVLTVNISATISVDLTIDGVSQEGYPKAVTWTELSVELTRIT